MPYNNNNYGGQKNYGGPRNSAPRTNNYAPQASTTGPRLECGRDGKFLDLNFWSKYASISIGTVQPGQQINWNSVREANITKQNLRYADLSNLWDICEEVMDSLKATGTFTPTGVIVGEKEDAIIEISNGSNIKMPMGIYLVIYKNIDGSRRSGEMDVYPFTDAKIIRGYDHMTGMCKDDISKGSDFRKFYRYIKEAAKAFTMAQAHSVSHSGYPDRLATFKGLAAIAHSMNIDISKELDALAKGTSASSASRQSGGSRQGGYSRPRTFEGGAGYNNGGYQQKQQMQMLADANDPVDISLGMNDLTNVDLSQFG